MKIIYKHCVLKENKIGEFNSSLIKFDKNLICVVIKDWKGHKSHEYFLKDKY
jgi:hypothetical protein